MTLYPRVTAILNLYHAQIAEQDLKSLPCYLCAGHKASNLNLRQLQVSGEPLSWCLVSNLQGVLPQCRILNFYGCTEAAGDSLSFEATSQDLPPRQDRSLLPFPKPQKKHLAWSQDDRELYLRSKRV